MRRNAPNAVVAALRYLVRATITSPQISIGLHIPIERDSSLLPFTCNNEMNMPSRADGSIERAISQKP